MGYGMYFGSKNLILRKDKFSFYIKLPSDIQHHFSGRVKVVRSLHTSDEDTASKIATNYRTMFDKAFVLLRADILDEEQKPKLIQNLLGEKVKKAKEKKVNRLDDIFDFYIQEKSSRWHPDTKHNFTQKFNVILTELGNKPIEEYSRVDILNLRDGFSKKFALKTCNEYISLLSSSFKQAVRHDMMLKNIAEGLVQRRQTRPDDERKRFEVEELQLIVDSLPLTPGLEWRVYVPLISMFSGMRREEVCQLHNGDIREHQGIWVFDINNKGDKEVKTEAAIRLVPIHPELLKLGLTEFVKGKEGNIWGFKKYRSKYGSKFGNWFSKWKPSIIDDEQKCFHSLRHSFTDTLKQAGEAESIISELVGHVVDSITFGRYGKRYRLDVLAPVVERLDYGLDLSRIDEFFAS